MDENHQRSMGADAGLAQNLGALFLHVRFGFVDIRHLEADMVLSAFRVFLKEVDDRRFLAQRLDNLQLRVRQVDEANAHALRRHVERLDELGSDIKRSVSFERIFDRRHRDADVVDETNGHCWAPD